ncbi:hypothetical protein MMC18_005963 [Xylographa bjoerkii]|nr:hypothetical protein [Xylographa bjoerkii]
MSSLKARPSSQDRDDGPRSEVRAHEVIALDESIASSSASSGKFDLIMPSNPDVPWGRTSLSEESDTNELDVVVLESSLSGDSATDEAASESALSELDGSLGNAFFSSSVKSGSVGTASLSSRSSSILAGPMVDTPEASIAFRPHLAHLLGCTGTGNLAGDPSMVSTSSVDGSTHGGPILGALEQEILKPDTGNPSLDSAHHQAYTGDLDDAGTKDNAKLEAIPLTQHAMSKTSFGSKGMEESLGVDMERHESTSTSVHKQEVTPDPEPQEAYPDRVGDQNATHNGWVRTIGGHLIVVLATVVVYLLEEALAYMGYL